MSRSPAQIYEYHLEVLALYFISQGSKSATRINVDGLTIETTTHFDVISTFVASSQHARLAMLCSDGLDLAVTDCIEAFPVVSRWMLWPLL